MNYEKLYKNIIKNRINSPVEGYTETHHIIPRSLGGNDNKENLVKLTAREHFICHYLLVKINKDNELNYYKMLNAFLMMKAVTHNHQRYFNSRLYEALRTNFSKLMSICQSGKNNSNYGKCWINKDGKSLSIKKEYLEQYLSLGYVKGRVNVHSEENRKNISLRTTGKKASEETRKKMSLTRRSINFHLSEESKKKIGLASSQRRHSEESKLKMSNSAKSKQKLKCPYCGKECDITNAKQWHFENCKFK